MNAAAYTVDPYNKHFEAIRAVADFELRGGPGVTFVNEVNLIQVEQLRSAAKGAKPSYTALVAKAVALALREFPYANRRVFRSPKSLWLGSRLQRFEQCDIAIATERNVPGAESLAFFDVFRSIDAMSLTTLTEALQAFAKSDVTSNAQWRTLNEVITRLPSWVSTRLIRLPYYFPQLWVRFRGAAVLISSPSKYGVDAVLAGQSYPLAVSFGVVKGRPMVSDGVLTVCPSFTLSMNFDRRVMAGAQAAKFFNRIVERLEHAQTELVEG